MKKFLIPIFGLAVLVSLGGWPSAARAQEPMAMNGQKTTVQQLLSGQGMNMVGRQIVLQDVEVRATTHKHAAWIGSNGHEKLLVLMPDMKPMNPDGKNTQMGEDDLVTITGTVEQAPPAAQLKHAWGVDGDKTSRVERAGVVVRASQITVLQHR